MASPLFAIEVHLVGDNWIVLEAGREIASHRQQRDALDHVERLLGIAEGDVDKAGDAVAPRKPRMRK
jgi:hypothetical protein